MGYSTVSTSMFSQDMRQTPKNIRKVLDVAGWTPLEASEEAFIGPLMLRYAIDGRAALPDAQWRRLLDKAGRRSFDHDSESA